MRNTSQHARGILLAGGKGSRLAPLTNSLSKQLLPICDKPMIYYPLVALMEAGIREILLISSPEHLPDYRRLLDNGKQWGIKLHYLEQPAPGGLPQAFHIGADFIGTDPVTLMLGDNIFFGGSFNEQLAISAINPIGATIFIVRHGQPSNYGVVELGPTGKVLSLEEKPLVAKSEHVVTGAYCFDHEVIEHVKTLRPSKRGELEMIDLIRIYHTQSKLRVKFLSEKTLWFDAGTPKTLSAASVAISNAQKKQKWLGVPEHVAKIKHWI